MLSSPCLSVSDEIERLLKLEVEISNIALI